MVDVYDAIGIAARADYPDCIRSGRYARIEQKAEIASIREAI
jgi:hypothetical protein